jgi:hypothetical protein
MIKLASGIYIKKTFFFLTRVMGWENLFTHLINGSVCILCKDGQRHHMNWLGTNKDNTISGVANPAVFKNESGVPSEKNYTLIWEVDSYSPIIEYNLLFRRYPVSKARI